MGGSYERHTQPLSVKEIVLIAEDFDFNPQVPFRFWLRTADTLLREAKIYEQEGNDQQAYLLFMRYAILVTARMPKHPHCKTYENRIGWNARVLTVNKILERLAVLKPRLNSRYEAYQQKLELERTRSPNTTSNGSDRELRHSTGPGASIPEASDPAVAGYRTTLDPEEDSALAVKLAHKEFRRRDALKRSPQKTDVAGLWDDWEAGLSKDGRSRGERSRQDEEMRRDMEASRHRLDGAHESKHAGGKNIARPISKSSKSVQDRNSGISYRYPSIQKSQPSQHDDAGSAGVPPPKPPKEFVEKYGQPPPYVIPPSLPAKTLVQTQVEEEEDNAEVEAPSSYVFKASAYLENGKPLRTIMLPPTLRERFLRYAAKNTSDNLETCGIICGKLMSNALFVTHLIIPEQISTSDTCETVNEVALFEYCEAQDLIVLGWIHTHPTQTCFMSSRDMHTHFGYQMMLAESIAIVCAPSKHPSWGVFRLTDPPGKQTIAECTNPGLFHPHSSNNIYTDALKPGHVMEATGLEYEVVDLRE